MHLPLLLAARRRTMDASVPSRRSPLILGRATATEAESPCLRRLPRLPPPPLLEWSRSGWRRRPQPRLGAARTRRARRHRSPHLRYAKCRTVTKNIRDNIVITWRFAAAVCEVHGGRRGRQRGHLLHLHLGDDVGGLSISPRLSPPPPVSQTPHETPHETAAAAAAAAAPTEFLLVSAFFAFWRHFLWKRSFFKKNLPSLFLV